MRSHLKPDDGSCLPVDGVPAPDARPRRPISWTTRLRAGFRVASALAGLAFAAILALALASLLALVIVRVGTDWLDMGATGRSGRLHPRQLAMRELAVDVIRQILLAGLVLAAVRRRDGPAWRRTLALTPEPGSGPGLPLRRFALILLAWPLIHITWVTGTAEWLRVPISRHGTLSPGLTAGAAAAWFAYVLVLAPVAEELLLRGALFGRVRRLISPMGTIAATSLLFTLAHWSPAGISRPVTLIPLALMLGWLRWRSGRLWPCMVLHAWSNFAMIAYVLWPASA